jgi:VWFA-related protein
MLAAMFPPVRRLSAALLLAAGAAAGLGAQREAAGGEPVGVDFFAVGPDGSVFDLRPGEVTLKIDGKNRRIRSLRYIGLPMATAAGLPAAREAPVDLEPPFGSNAPTADGRWVTIVLDHESIRAGAERNAINAVVRYVNTLGVRDRVAYVTMPNGGIEIDFTTNHQQIIEKLRGFIARAPREQTTQERSCRSRLLLNTMSDYVEGMVSLPGPKTIVLVSSGILNPRRDAPMLGPPGPCEIRQVYFQDVAKATSLARVHIHVVQPDDLHMDPARQVFADPTASRFAGADEDRAGLESLAGVTGGDFMRIVGPDDPTLTSLTRHLTGYYIATFDPEPGERNGALHRAEVSVAREGVRVKTRPEVLIPRLVGSGLNAPVKDMLRGGLYRALPLRVTALTSAGAGGKVKVLAVLEGIETDVKLSQAVFGLIGPRQVRVSNAADLATRDVLVAQWTANAAELAESPVVTAGEAVPGPYRLRVAAIDAAGRRGTTEYEFVASLTDAAPLSLSALALGISRDGAFSPKLVFGTDQAAVAYFEIYGAPPKSDSVTVRLEIADAQDARALVTAVARVVGQGSDRRAAVGALPIAALAPGDYVVRAIVSIDSRPVGRITRTLRKAPLG